MALTADQRRQYGETYIKQAFQDLLGRAPSQIEIDRFYPSMGTDPNIHDTATLRSRVAEYAQQEKDKNKPDEQKAKLEAQAKTYEPGIANLIKSTLGRDPTAEETAHFANLKAQGFDDYELGQALQQLPEYQQQQDQTARTALSGELQTADQQFFQEHVMPSIQSQFAQQGRSFEGAGFQAALANAAKDIQSQRSTYLAGLGREDYVNRRSQAINQYVSDLGRQYNLQDYATQRSDQLSDIYRNRAYEQSNYDQERAAYADYLRNYGKQKKSGLFGGVGQLAGMGIGALLAAPTGGMSIGAGAMLGGAAGGIGGSLFDQ